MGCAAPLLSASTQDAPTPIPQDLVGSYVAPADQSDQVFTRHGLRAIFPVVHRKPLLVVAWRTDDPDSLESAVPAAPERAQQFAGDLVPLFVERSGRGIEEMLRVVCRRRWLCPDALWTCEPPTGFGVMPSPSFVLTSMGHKLCRGGPSALANLFRKLAKEHAWTQAAERALVYARLVQDD